MLTHVTHCLQVERALKNLEASVAGYNTAADRLQLIPATAKRAERIGYEITVNRQAADLLSVDLKVRDGGLVGSFTCWFGCNGCTCASRAAC